MINGFCQLGNIAGSYVWDLKDNGYRKSYGIVTAMFGVTIMGTLAFRMVLSNLNRKLEEQERRVMEENETEHGSGEMNKGFRYVV